MKAFIAWLVSVLDVLSALLGRLIWVKVDGRWRPWTDNGNESTSVAAARWAMLGKFVWAERAIDFLFPWEKNHCRQAFAKDYERAAQFQVKAELAWPELYNDYLRRQLTSND